MTSTGPSSLEVHGAGGGIAAVGTLVADASGKVVHASAGARSILGETSGDLASKSLVELATPADRDEVTDWVGRLSGGSEPLEPIEFFTVVPGGGVAKSRAQVTRSESGKDTVIVELTAGGGESAATPEEAAARLGSMLDRLDRANRALATDGSPAGLSRPVVSSAASVEALIRDPAPRSPGRQPIRADLLQRLAELSAAVEEAVSSSKAGLRLDIRALDGDALIDEVLAGAQRLIEESSAEVHVEPIGTVTADRRQLRNALGRLVVNAIQHRRPDRRLVVSIGVERPLGRSVLVVADNGSGIAPGDRERVLEGSEGRGLAICRRIVAGHGGEMTLHDGIDGGTAVHLDLPEADAETTQGVVAGEIRG
ncbi:MAG TPA: HAMP domain-containing sensor histidine kinase [Acidimicrobiales bacterium]|nr:HAMP domain-containing sensor histidine kinase [Acidimicrobiales bacterium]